MGKSEKRGKNSDGKDDDTELKAGLLGKKLGVPIVDVIRNHHDRLAIIEKKIDDQNKDESTASNSDNEDELAIDLMSAGISREEVARMFAAQNAVFKELLREQRKCYDGALSAVMNEILVALGESEVGAAGSRLDKLETRIASLEKTNDPGEMLDVGDQLPEVKLPSWNPFGRSKNEDEEEVNQAKTEVESAKESSVQQKPEGLPGFLSGLFGGSKSTPRSSRSGSIEPPSVTYSMYKRDREKRRVEREQQYKEDYEFYKKFREKEKREQGSEK